MEGTISKTYKGPRELQRKHVANFAEKRMELSTNRRPICDRGEDRSPDGVREAPRTLPDPQTPLRAHGRSRGSTEVGVSSIMIRELAWPAAAGMRRSSGKAGARAPGPLRKDLKEASTRIPQGSYNSATGTEWTGRRRPFRRELRSWRELPVVRLEIRR